MAKKRVVENWDAIAVYTGDSANFHIYQVVNDNMVGSIYVNKAVNPVPQGVVLNFLHPSHKDWRKNVEALLDKTRDGSKARVKLNKILKEHS